MATKLKVRTIDNPLGVGRTHCDPHFEAAMTAFEETRCSDRNALRELAKGAAAVTPRSATEAAVRTLHARLLGEFGGLPGRLRADDLPDRSSNPESGVALENLRQSL